MAQLNIGYKIDGSSTGLKNLSEVISRMGQDSGLTGQQMNFLEQSIAKGLATGKSFNDVLKNLFNTLKGGSSDLAAHIKQLQQMANEANKAALSYKEASVAARSAQGILQSVGASLPGGSAGIMGLLGGAGQIGMIAGATTAVVGLAAGLTGLFASAAAGAREVQNLGIRLGVSTAAAQKLTYEAKLTGVNIASLEQSARLLGQALDDPNGSGKKQTAMLERMGISTHETNGEMREMGAVLLDVLDKLRSTTNDATRMHEATVLLGRGAKEIQPMLEGLSQSMKDFLAGEGLDNVNKLNESLLKGKQAISEMDIAWDIFKKKLAEKIAPIEIKFIGATTSIMSGSLRNPFRTQGANDYDPLGVLFGATPNSPVNVLRGGNPINPAAGIGAPEGSLQTSSSMAGNAEAQRIKAQFDQTKDGLEAVATAQKKIAADAHALATRGGDDLKYVNEQHAIELKALAAEAAAREKLKALETYQTQSEKFRTMLEETGGHAPTSPQALEKLFGNAKDEQIPPILKEFNKLQNDPAYKKFVSEASANVDIGFEKFATQSLMHGLPGSETKEHKASLEDVKDWLADLRRQEEIDKAQEAAKNKLTKETADIQAKSASDAAKQQRELLQIQRAQESGLTAHRRATGDILPREAAREDFADQLASIQQQKEIEVKEALTQARGYQAAANKLPEGTEQMAELAKATEAQARAAEAENKATLSNVEALNKFQAAIDASAAALADKFGKFSEGLLGAAEKGRSSEYVRKFFENRANEIGGELATKLFSSSGAGQLPGMDLIFGGKGALGKFMAGPTKAPFMTQGPSDTLNYDIMGAKANPSLEANSKSLDAVKISLDNLNIAISGGKTGTGPSTDLTDAITGSGSATAGITPTDLMQLNQSPKQIEAALNAAFPSGPTGDMSSASAGMGLAAQAAAMIGAPKQLISALSQGSKQLQALAKTSLGHWSAPSGSSAMPFGDYGPPTPSINTNGGDYIDSGGGNVSGSGSGDGSYLAVPEGFQGAGGMPDATDLGSLIPEGFQGAGGAPDLSTIDFGNTPGISGGSSMAGAIAMGGTAALSAVSSALSSVGKMFSGGSQGMLTTAITGTTSTGASVGTMGQIGAGLGAAGAIFGGATELMGGLKTDGARGAFQDVAGVATMISTVFPPAAIVAMGANLVASLFGDPRAIRGNKITEELQGAAYNAPNPISISETSNGLMSTTNYRGQQQVINARPTIGTYNEVLGFSAVQGQHNDLLTTPERFVTPGALLPTSQSPAPQATTVVIQAMDSKSFLDHSGDIAQAVRHALQGGHSLTQTITNTVKPH